MPLVKINVARKPAAVQRFRASPRSIAPASLILARLARLSRCQFSVPQVVVATAMRAIKHESIVSDELELVGVVVVVVKRTPERHGMVGFVVVEFPARTVQGVVFGWRDCVFAVGTISGLVAAGAGADCDVGVCCTIGEKVVGVGEEEVGVDATGRFT